MPRARSAAARGRHLNGAARRAAGAPRVRITIRLTPGAGRDRIDDVAGGILRVRVAAPPVDGAANQALIALLAAELGVARGKISIARGASGRLKVVEIEHVEATAIRSRWPGVDV